MNLKTLLACLMLLPAARAFAEPPENFLVMDPNDPAKKRPLISREQREQLGLREHTWPGVVEPEVYATLDRLEEIVTTLRESETPDPQMILFFLEFPGRVYVQVHLRNESHVCPSPEQQRGAIRDAQRRVLESIKASELHVAELYEGLWGFVGYASPNALEKLAAHPDVAGVCLDEQPLVIKRERVFKDLSLVEGDESTNTPDGIESNVEPDVYRAFAIADWVDVTIVLRGNETLPALTDDPSQMWSLWKMRDEAVRTIQGAFLSSFNGYELRPWSDARAILVLTATVTRDGVDKMRQHPDVETVRLPQLVRSID